MKIIHDRMPAILNTKQKYDMWLTGNDTAVLMVVYPVSKMVNSVKLNQPRAG